MRALRENGFAVPEPIAHSRHTIVMSLVDAFPLRQIREVPDPAGLYAELMEMVLRLAKWGLIHGDFNEFNILIKEEVGDKALQAGEADATSSTVGGTDGDAESVQTTTLIPILIDFPQMVSMSHPDAAMYFDRDVNCVKSFFKRRFHFTSSTPGPFFEDAKKTVGRDGVKRLDIEAEASGFSKKMSKELEAYMREVGVDGDGRGEADAEDDSDEGKDAEDEMEEEESKEFDGASGRNQSTLAKGEATSAWQDLKGNGDFTEATFNSIDSETRFLSLDDKT